MGDRRLETHASRRHEPHGVLQVLECADVREQVPQASFAQRVDIDLEGLAEPGHADNLSSRSNGVYRMQEGLMSGKTLCRTAARAFENDIGAIAAGHLADDRNRVAF